MRRRASYRGGVRNARLRLRAFRQATIIAVAITGFLLLLFSPEDALDAATPGEPESSLPVAVAAAQDAQPAEDPPERIADVRADTLVGAATREARETVRELWLRVLANAPKAVIALLVLLAAWLATRLSRPLLLAVLGGWERSNAAAALVGVAIWMIAFGIAVSVLAGDIRALVGSLGLAGLALSWALQTPIESFAGWLMNSFHGYYRVGDRVAVGDILGDVYRIDFLTTTVWEMGSPSRPGFVQAEQPTGRLITFPNNEVLAGSIVNYTRDFPYVWDELAIQVGNRSDMRYAIALVERIARDVLGEHMAQPAEAYEQILRRARLEIAVPREPHAFISLDESGTTISVRYLVGARERRVWKSRLSLAMSEEMAREEHEKHLVDVFPRRQIQLIGPDGRPREIPGSGEPG
jgi:small-conductance mechanosensitive channel